MYQFSNDDIFEILICAQTDCGGDIVLSLNNFCDRQVTSEEYSNFVMQLRDMRWGWIKIRQNIRKGW